MLCHPPFLSAFCFPELVRSKCDADADAMKWEDDDHHDSPDDTIDDGVIIVMRQHIVMERALVWCPTDLDSNHSSFIFYLLRSATGFTFLSLCFRTVKW